MSAVYSLRKLREGENCKFRISDFSMPSRVTYKTHFTFTVSIPEIEGQIYNHQNILSSLPRPHPRRAECLLSIAGWRMKHYGLSDCHEQLNKSILHLTEALLHPLPRTRHPPNTDRLLFSLALVLYLRSTKFKHLDDVQYCVKYLRYLRDQPLRVPDASPDEVTSFLVLALGVQVELKSEDFTEDIEEMTILCYELLNSDILASLPPAPFIVLAAVVNTKQVLTGQVGDQVIERLREANLRLPHFHQLSLQLACSLTLRLFITHSNDEYEEATTILDRTIASTSHLPEDIRGPLQDQALQLIAMLAISRTVVFRDPEYVEEAIFHVRTYLSSAFFNDPHRPRLSWYLAELMDRRVQEFGVGGVQERCSSDPEIVDLPSLSSLTASLTEPNSPMTSTQWAQHILAISHTVDITDIAEIEEAIKYLRLSVASIHRDPSLPLADVPACRLGYLLFCAFKRTNKIEYLDESIAVYRDGLAMPGTMTPRFASTMGLSVSLGSRFGLLWRREDLDEIMQLAATTATDTYLDVSYRFQASCDWAWKARLCRHPSVTAAYENAISLMQDSLSYAPTLEVQHFRLLSMHDFYEELPLDYASHLVDTGQFNKAIKTLERGRSLLWSEMRGFRTSADQLGAVDSALTEKFVAINRDLEKLTMSIGIDGSEVDGLEGMDPFGRLVVKQRKLLEERDKLISQIRALPDLNNFLTVPSFDTLRSVSSRGPIIIINHSKWRSDILILFYHSPPSLLTTADDFYDRAIQLSDRLMKTRKGHHLESKQYQRALRSVLESLYGLVGRPVIEEFRKMKIPEQSRVWWCPTSVFCSLPLHAMGPIPLDSEHGVMHYFSDLYIPSYTPTLSALIASCRPRRQTSQKPSILLVAQPESLGDANPEIGVIQRLNTTVASLISESATPSSVMEGLRHHQSSHFVCHGKLEAGKPFNASFELYGGRRLTLLDIVRSRLPTAEFAFLSAFHTAELTEESIADEALHLTAAMQYCGFRSVVGTMWAMADRDGRDLVEDFYKSILSSDEPGAPHYERSAKALRDAVQNLRRKKGLRLERWVNYVHYGA
jgi:CHAT domain-containing protein